MLQLTLGELAEARRLAEQSVAFANRSGDGFRRMDMCTILADVLIQLGLLDAAGDLFREAEKIQKERQPVYPLLYSVPGYRYCDLLLEKGYYEDVLKRAKQALEIVLNGFQSLLDITLNHLSLGRALLLKAQAEEEKGGNDFWEKATHHLNQAVNGLRQAG